MDNPLKPLLFIWQARKPSKLADMPARRNTFWLRKGFSALTFFGTIITASKEEAERLNKGLSNIKVHEMIHLRQAQSLHDSWMLFYLRYLWYYLRGLPQNRHMRKAAYMTNPFELEAYRHQNDAGYLEQCREGAHEWRLYAKMKPSQRLEEYRHPTMMG